MLIAGKMYYPKPSTLLPAREVPGRGKKLPATLDWDAGPASAKTAGPGRVLR